MRVFEIVAHRNVDVPGKKLVIVYASFQHRFSISF